MIEFKNQTINLKAKNILSIIEKVTQPNNYESLFQNGINVAEKLLDDCVNDLNYITKHKGNEKETLIQLNDEFALAVSGCIKFSLSPLLTRVHAIDYRNNKQFIGDAKLKIVKATKLMAIVTSLEVSDNARVMIQNVTQILSQIEGKVQGPSGCYIATCVYDDYNSSQVLFLRYFRDKYLLKSNIGSLFVKAYYQLSPILVKLFRNSCMAKTIIRRILNILIKLIQQNN